MPLDIITVPCLRDNYAYLLRDTATGRVGLIDAPEAGPIEAALAELDLGLDLILVTHHHNDHIAGVEQLRARFGARVAGAASDGHRLPALDHALAEGDTLDLGESAAYVIAVPGHTLGHVAYHFRNAQALFSADSLMVMGCGRLFEGTAELMWESLGKLAALPDATAVYSGHEYAETNMRFASALGPETPALAERAAEIAALRRAGQPTVPAPLSLERRTNPFLRAGELEMKRHLGLEDAADAAVFAEIRRRKDRF